MIHTGISIQLFFLFYFQCHFPTTKNLDKIICMAAFLLKKKKKRKLTQNTKHTVHAIIYKLHSTYQFMFYLLDYKLHGSKLL